MVSFIIPSADNNANWLSYRDDLSLAAQKEACESFVKFASLNEETLRKLITTEEKATGVLGEEYIEKEIHQLKKQQIKAVEVFYDEMIKHRCIVPEAIVRIKEYIETEKQRIANLAIELATGASKNAENISPNLETKKRSSPTQLSPNSKKKLTSKLDFEIEIPQGVKDGLKNASNLLSSGQTSYSQHRKKTLSIDIS